MFNIILKIIKYAKITKENKKDIVDLNFTKIMIIYPILLFF